MQKSGLTWFKPIGFNHELNQSFFLLINLNILSLKNLKEKLIYEVELHNLQKLIISYLYFKNTIQSFLLLAESNGQRC